MNEENVEQIDEASLAKLAADHWKNHSAAAYGGNEGYSEKQLNRYRERADKILSDVSQTHGADVAKAVKQHSSDAAEMENASAGNVDKNFHKNFANNVLGGVGSKNHEKYKSYVDKEGANHHLDEEGEETMMETTELTEEQIREERLLAIKEAVKQFKGNMKEDVDALFNGESLSEEFRGKATLIFESAVTSRVESILEQVMQENDEVLATAYDEIKDQITEQVDEYLNYVVEQWMDSNKVAIETGLRAELAEDFISGLRSLFQEHYIEIPEEKVDVAETLATELEQAGEYVQSVHAHVEEQEAVIADLQEQLDAVKKEKSIDNFCEGLTSVQAAKMKALAEGVEFTTEGDFEEKLAVLRENYFSSKVQVKSEVKEIQQAMLNEEPEVGQTNNIMARYVKSISKTAPKA